MASFDSAFNFVLPLEDTHPSGNVQKDSDGLTRYGLLDRWHPELTAEGFYTTDKQTALGMAKNAYLVGYWNHFSGSSFQSNKVAAQIFSIGVNQGMGTSVKLAQLVAGVQADGSCGPITVAAINAIPEATFISSFNDRTKSHYNDIVATNPAKAEDLKGWYNRVDAINNFHG